MRKMLSRLRDFCLPSRRTPDRPTGRLRFRRIAALALLAAGASGAVQAQQSNLSCSLRSVPFVNGITPSFTVTQSTVNSGTSTWLLPARTVDADTTNFATGTIGLTGGLELTVSDAANTYASGDFTGFTLASSLINLSALGSLTVTTLLNGTVQETVTGSNLIAANAGVSGAYEVGFYTNQPFNAVRINITSTLGVGSYFVYNAILRGTGSCTSPALVCNTSTSPTFPAYAVVLDPARTGVTGLAVGALSNTAALVDNDATTYATLTTTTAVLGTASVAVKDAATTYPANTFAGFDLQNATLLSTSVLGNITVNTYRDGVLKQSRSGTGLALGATVLGTAGRQTVGFVADSTFDEVQLVISQPALVSLGTTRIYAPVLRRLCAGPALACNTPTAPTESAYPVYINAANTGFSGAACVACSITGTGNLVDNDATTAATIVQTAGVLTSGQVAVRDAITDYPAGTLAGFEIANTSLLDLTLLSNVSISVYRDGVLKQTRSGSGLLVAVPAGALTGSTGRQTLGFVTDSTFDEVRLALAQTVGVNLGTTTVYSPVLQRFCGGAVACSTVAPLNAPAQAVVVDQRLTGITGAVCALCAVNNPAAVTSASTTDFAQLVTTLGVASSSSIAVQDVVNTYPARTFAGYTIGNPAQLVQATLLQSLTLATYNNGVFQESRTGTGLLNLSVVLGPGAADSIYNISFPATLPFDEVRISATPVAGVAPTINVYGAFADTRYVDTLVGGAICYKAPLAEPDHAGVPQDSVLTGAVRVNDRDPQGSALLYQTTAAVGPQHGTLTLAADGSYTYVPTAGYSGRDSFAYTVCNVFNRCSTAWAYVAVTPPRVTNGPNNAPNALPDFSQTYANIAVSGSAAGNDTDPDSNTVLTYAVVTAPRRGQLALAANGTYIYTPAAGFVGADTALIQVCDNGTPALCRTSRLTVAVYPTFGTVANRAPFAQNDVVVTPSGTAATGNVRTNDSDPDGDVLTTSLIGTVPVSQGTMTLNANGSFTFQPATGFVGTVSIPYRACDASVCDTAMLTVVVQRNGLVNPLPLTLVSFTGSGRDCSAQLEWQSANENAVDRFDVEASNDGSRFETVGAVPAQNVKAGTQYRFSHPQATEVAYYRLRVVDLSGSFAYSGTVPVRTGCATASLPSLAPNPTTGAVTVSNLPESARIEVYNSLGQRVAQVAAPARQLNLHGLPAGRYQVRIIPETGAPQSLPLLLQH